MNEKEIKMSIWMLLQDNMHREDILERSKSEEHKKLVRENMKKAEKEIEDLRKQLREIAGT